MIKNILIDLDCTLLPMDQDEFLEEYFKLIALKVSKLGINIKDFIEHFNFATYKMIKNDGKNTNEYVFWDYINKYYGDYKLKELFEDFYFKDFKLLKHHISFQPLSKEVLTILNNKGYKVIIATNPLFPMVATKERMSWNNLSFDDAMYVTTYENSSFSKPSNDYYLEIINKFNLDITECMMVGNDMEDDFSQISPQIQTYLITDCLMNKKNKPLLDNRGTMIDFYNFVLNLPVLK